MAKEKNNTWVHIQIQESDLLLQLDEMVKQDDQDRSKFIRKLIRQEWSRRVQQQLLMFEPPQGKYKAGSK
jgi:metal-responsive CopG/Arc/MetJ family transcriptional regulator